MSQVRVAQLCKSYGKFKALDDVSATFPDGEFFGLLGPSGSGKTTLLRAIAGFIFADSGAVYIGDQSVEQIPVEKRQIGMVFQNYALFPNMTVADNVGFGLRVRKDTASVIAKKVHDALELVQLGHLAKRKPQELSGGQRQRVALARAVVTQPRVLLLDEPLSALDKALRVEMQVELKRIQREVGITTIFVTHDQEEALTLSDRIGILKDGKLIQQGTPREVYNQPASIFVAGFLGEANIFEVDRDSLRQPLITDMLPGLSIGESAEIIALAVRPENLHISIHEPATKKNLHCLKAVLRQKIFAGAMATCLVDWHDTRIKVLARDRDLAALPESGEVWLSWPQQETILLTAR